MGDTGEKLENKKQDAVETKINLEEVTTTDKPGVKINQSEDAKTIETVNSPVKTNPLEADEDTTVKELAGYETNIEDLTEKAEDGQEEHITEESDKTTQPLKSPSTTATTKGEAVTPTESPSPRKPRDTHMNRNQSDILPSLKEIPRDEDPSMMIFSHKGLPTKKYAKRRPINSSILPFGCSEREVVPLKEPLSPRLKSREELTPKISQTVPRLARTDDNVDKKLAVSDRTPHVPNSNPSIPRNVLTGQGVNSNDEFRSRSMKRKDGNPVLGLGYDEPAVTKNTGRVPPGGFSSGLW